jgi:hypothetical protein
VLVDAGSHVGQTYQLSVAGPDPLPWPITRPGDANWDGVIGVGDLLAVLSSFGPCNSFTCEPCYADIAPLTCADSTCQQGDNIVDFDDVLAVITNWDQPLPASGIR